MWRSTLEEHECSEIEKVNGLNDLYLIRRRLEVSIYKMN